MMVALSTTLADRDKTHTCTDINRGGDINQNKVQYIRFHA